MVIAGDVVPGVVADKTKLEPKTGYDVFPFPSIGAGGENTIVGGGDSLVMFKDTPAARALFEYLVSKEAHEIWGEARRVLLAEQECRRAGLSRRHHPHDRGRRRQGRDVPLRHVRSGAGNVRRDRRAGRAEDPQDFLQKPSDADGTVRKLAASAAKAFK